jgi:uncharacterized protein (UPF0218 family)
LKKIKDLINTEKPRRIITVGDIVSKNMIKYGLPIDVIIVDNKTMREPIPPIKVETDQTLYAKNPPGTITNEAWISIKQAINNNGRTKVVIEGEEDLLTIVTVLLAPDNSLVLYGQPHRGIVVVKVNQKTKQKMQNILNAMDIISKS